MTKDDKTLQEREAELVDVLMSDINTWITHRQSYGVTYTDIDYHVARALIRVTRLTIRDYADTISEETLKRLSEYDAKYKNEQEPGT